jgi:Ser-tRNA(Ala) deacylase AlaX
MLSQAMDIHSVSHPVRKLIEKNLGTITFTAEITEDKQTINLLKNNIPGIVAFLCTLKKDNIIISEGRGESVINPENKYISKNITFAKNASIIDSIVRASKVLDILPLDTSSQPNSGLTLNKSYEVVKEVKDQDYITDKQKNYLLTLIRTNVAENKRRELENEIVNYSRDDASELIKSLVK